MIPGFLVSFFSNQTGGDGPAPGVDSPTIRRTDVFFSIVIDKGETTFYNDPFVDPVLSYIKEIQIANIYSAIGSYAPAFRNSSVISSMPFETAGHTTGHVPENHNVPTTYVFADQNNMETVQSIIEANSLVVYFFEVDRSLAPSFRNTLVESNDPFITFNPYTANTYSNVLDSVDFEQADYGSLNISFDPNANP